MIEAILSIYLAHILKIEKKIRYTYATVCIFSIKILYQLFINEKNNKNNDRKI